MLIRVMTSSSDFLFMRPFGLGSLFHIEVEILINIDEDLTGMNSQ